jgi:hypothetical protein
MQDSLLTSQADLNYIRKLDNVIESFPQEFSIHKILPELINAFEYGAGNTSTLMSHSEMHY